MLSLKFPLVSIELTLYFIFLCSYAILAGGSSSSVAASPAAPSKAVAAAPATKKDDFDDMFGESAEPAAAKADEVDDMFGDDDEDGETAEEKVATKARKERMALAKKLKEEADAKSGKVKKAEKGVEKSLVVLEVKPWEADTDLEALWHKIKEYTQEGLTWGESFKLEPVAYGIMKLVMVS